VGALDIASRARFLALVACLGLVAIAWPGGRAARAQDSDRGPTAAAPGGVDDGTSETPAADQGGGGLEGREPFLVWMARASGPIGLAILVMSIYLVALVVWMFLHYRTPVTAPSDLVGDLQDLLQQAKYNEAYHRLAEDDSFLARVVAAGVRKLPMGPTQAHRAMELANEDVTMKMEHRTTYLATVGTLGPMIGLVGTVYGMIMAFRVIAQAGSSPQASDLARGISTALFATLFGIAISIPAIFFYALFRNRIARLSLEVGMQAEPLLEQFTPGVRMAGPGPGPGAGAGTSSPSPPPHAHPFAVSAAMAAAAGGNAGRPALPPTGPPPPVSSDLGGRG
jgi:biopolymer transport protein ExbB